MNIHAPPEVLIEREKSNRALAREGWGSTLRLVLLRSSVAPVASLGLIWRYFFG